MRDTSNFRTKTSFIKRKNAKTEGVWEIAIDIGYSAVKLFSPNIVARFPSYAKRVDESFTYAVETPASSILYKDLETGQMWLVGEKAQDIMTASDTSDSEATLYGRERYYSEMYKVITNTGLGIGLMPNEYGSSGNDKLVVQTGLPERYMDDDEEEIIDSLAGTHRFALKIANGDWQQFDFELQHEDVFVMSQPKGTLFSVCMNTNGTFHANAKKYLSSSVIIFDPGFGTLDIFPILNGTVANGETYQDLGMKRILQETSRLIKDNFKVNIPVPAMQKYLSTGKVRYVNKKSFPIVSKEYEFGDLLADASSMVCQEAIKRMMGAIKLDDYNYMIVTGGTGAAWFNQIKDIFKEFSTLEIIQGNQNDDLPFVFSNVRGYYYYRYNKLKAANHETNE